MPLIKPKMKLLYACNFFKSIFLTAMVEVPGELEPVCGEVEVPDLVREDGGVALLPRRDRQVVARAVVAQRDVLHARQFLCVGPTEINPEMKLIG